MTSLESCYTGAPGEAQALLDSFWTNVLDEIKNVQQNDFKTQELPLARIKKIMKLDEDVKMISAEAPVLFAKAAEIFITELTLRAWIHAEDNKRRTLQRNDIATAISKYDQFDFLIDIVPRDDIRPTTTRRPDENTMRTSVGAGEQLQYFVQVPQPTQISASPVIQQPTVIQQPLQLSAILSQQSGLSAATSPAVSQQSLPVASPVPTQLQVYTQVVGANGELQQIPIQLTQSQIQAITLQMQGSRPGQPVVIQTTSLDQSHDTPASPQPMFQMPMFVQSTEQELEQDVEPDQQSDE
jgi:nuclear transcription factor Y gamma